MHAASFWPQRRFGHAHFSPNSAHPYSQDELAFMTGVCGQIALVLENALACQEISELKDKLAQEKLYLEEEIRSEMNFDQIVGDSPHSGRSWSWSKQSRQVIPRCCCSARLERERNSSRVRFTITGRPQNPHLREAQLRGNPYRAVRERIVWT
jgi:hypothetical protein